MRENRKDYLSGNAKKVLFAKRFTESEFFNVIAGVIEEKAGITRPNIVQLFLPNSKERIKGFSKGYLYKNQRYGWEIIKK